MCGRISSDISGSGEKGARQLGALAASVRKHWYTSYLVVEVCCEMSQFVPQSRGNPSLQKWQLHSGSVAMHRAEESEK